MVANSFLARTIPPKCMRFCPGCQIAVGVGLSQRITDQKPRTQRSCASALRASKTESNHSQRVAWIDQTRTGLSNVAQLDAIALEAIRPAANAVKLLVCESLRVGLYLRWVLDI